MNWHKVALVLLSTVLVSIGWTESRPQDLKNPYPQMAPAREYLIAERESEIALARSAAPLSISGNAQVLVLGAHGYEIAIKGNNGFVCMVERSWDANFDAPEFWNPKIRGPDCFNPPAARSQLPIYLMRTEWVLAGATRQQLIEKTKAALAKHGFERHEEGSFSFMLSKQGYLGDSANGPWLPHLMFFVPYLQGNLWGANKKGSPAISQDFKAIETTIVFVPVLRWSDGSPALPSAGGHNM